MTDFRNQAIYALSPDGDWMWDDGNLIWCSPNVAQPTQAEIDAKLAELEAAKPLRLLRIERNRLLQETDWEITRGLEEGLNIDSLKTYRTALRNLPQQIEAGEITAPTLNDNGMLVFEHWPERTDA
jgi:hypothetical protein